MKPAASLILLREREGAVPEYLLLKRGATMRFAPDALVFPGGQVDAEDFEAAHRISGGEMPDIDDLAARIAAIRETIEEAGIALGIDPIPTPDDIEALRLELASGEPLLPLLERRGLLLNLNALAPYARWQPPVDVAHRFDTRFYLAAAPENAIESVDGSENVHAFWADPAEVLRETEAGLHRLIFPTRCTLARLALHDNLTEALADADRNGGRLVTPRVEERSGEKWLCIDPDIGYPITELPFHAAR